ncbi:MAG: alpha-glycosidase [Planctomycetota bacterium]|nr:MAG: alpha-glycosidase [Planctomycetota bacterium]
MTTPPFRAASLSVGMASAALLACVPGAARAAVRSEALPGGARHRVTFSYRPVIACRSVALAGSFNGWSTDAEFLRDPDGDGTWTLTRELPRGVHRYKFVVNGNVWLHDADNPRTEPDGHSGLNSVLDLGAAKPRSPGRTGDGAMDLDWILHDPRDLAHVCAVDGNRRWVVRVHTLADDVERVWVEASPRPRGARTGAVAARKIARWEGRDVWEARLCFARAPRTLRYAFRLEDGTARARFPAGRERFRARASQAGRFQTPEWVRDAVFYQIFPDRFRDGDPRRQPDLPPRPPGTPWSIDDAYLETWGSRPSHFNFLGGDLAGVLQSLDYLEGLGVTAIYLNPIFAAASNHRYDTSDYERIDPALGDLDTFHALRDAARERGMRLLLDGVFNHTGDTHYAFRDAVAKGPRSKYWDWYFFDGGYPVVRSPKPNYRAWWGFGSLPQLNTKNPEVVEHLLSVGVRWLREGAAGWRLDVPNEVEAVNPDFWPRFRRRLREEDPSAYIVGEIWTDPRHWLQGDRFDAVMNYPLRSAVLEFIVKGGGDAASFADALQAQLATLPEPALRVQFNLLGSHDTPRVLTLAGGDARRVRLAQTFLFAWLGAPVVYYGDEVGLDGGKDPECRKAFPWDPARQDRDTLAHVRALGALRKSERALRRGEVRFLLARGRQIAFARTPASGEAGRPVVCVLNAGGRAARIRVPLGDLAGRPLPLLGAEEVSRQGDELVLTLPAYGGALCALSEERP